MSVNLTTSPPLYAFSADQIVAKFNCTNYYQSIGAYAKNELSFSSGITAGTTIVIKYGVITVTMTASSTPDDTGTQFMAGPSSALLLIGYFSANYFLSRDFDLTASGSKITFIAKEKQLGYNFQSGDAGAFNLQNVIAGSVPVMKPKYGIAFRLYCENPDHDGFELIYSSKLSLIGKTGTVEVPIGDKLHNYVTKDISSGLPDIPVTDPILCKISCRRYYFDYAESYGNEVFGVTAIAVCTILHGGMSTFGQATKELATLLSNADDPYIKFLKQGGSLVSTRSNQKQYLYFFNLGNALSSILKCRLRFTDGSKALVDLFNLTMDAQRKYAFNVSYENIFNQDEYPGRSLLGYEVWVADAEGNRISQTQTYLMDYNFREFVRYFLNWSSWGTMDSRVFYGKGSSEFDISQSVATTYPRHPLKSEQGTKRVFDVKIKSKFLINTGFLKSREILINNRDFFVSALKYRVIGEYFLPIVVTTKTIQEIEDGNNLYAQKFEYEYLFEDHAFTEGDVQEPGIVYSNAFTGFNNLYLTDKEQNFLATSINHDLITV